MIAAQCLATGFGDKDYVAINIAKRRLMHRHVNIIMAHRLRTIAVCQRAFRKSSQRYSMPTAFDEAGRVHKACCCDGIQSNPQMTDLVRKENTAMAEPMVESKSAMIETLAISFASRFSLPAMS